MATHRKTASRPRAGARKPAGAPRPARVAGKPKAAPAARPGHAAAGKGKPPSGTGAANRPPAAASGRAPKGKPRLAVAKRPAAPAARPLGVLPPESRMRSAERQPIPAAVRPRAAADVRPATGPPRPGGGRVTEKDFKEFEERLLAERSKIMKEMGHLENTVLKVNQRESSGDLSGYSFHMADVGTDAMEREKAFLFASTEGRILMEINEALRRLYRGDYGVCESCGEPIARARLEAMPYARLCLACKTKEERASRGAP